MQCGRAPLPFGGGFAQQRRVAGIHRGTIRNDGRLSNQLLVRNAISTAHTPSPM